MRHPHVRALVVADHQAALRREPPLLQQLADKERARFFHAGIRGDVNAVKGVRQTQHAQLRHGEAGLGVAEQIERGAVFPQGGEHWPDPGIEAQLLERLQPEKDRGILHAPPVGSDPLLRIQRAKDLPELDLVQGVAVARDLRAAEAGVGRPQLVRAVGRAVLAVIQGGLFPEAGAALVGPDLRERAVEIEKIGLIRQTHTRSASFGTVKITGFPPQAIRPPRTATAEPSSRFT